jgi:hypothetical protein
MVESPAALVAFDLHTIRIYLYSACITRNKIAAMDGATGIVRTQAHTTRQLAPSG